MNLLEKLSEKIANLQDILADLEHSYRELDTVLNELEDEQDNPEPGLLVLPDKLEWEVAQALGRPQWSVTHDPEAAILELCEKVMRTKP